MLTIVGDVIEYDGKPFAIITAPLSGLRMDAIDYIENLPKFRPSNLPMKDETHKNMVRAPNGNLIKW